MANAQESPVGQGVKQEIITESYGNWKLRCITVQTESPPILHKQCELMYVAQMKEDNIALTVLTLSFASYTSNDKKKSSFVMTSIGPLNIYLPEGITYSVDGSIPYEDCFQ